MAIVPLRLRRTTAIRRLDLADCERLGFAPPLSLHAREARGIVGPWRRTGGVVVVQGAADAVWSGTAAELEALGVRLDA